MAKKACTDDAEDFSDLKPYLESYTLPDHYDFEKSLPWLYGDRYYLQISQQDFIDLFSHKEKNENTIEKSDPAELIEIGKRALEKGELEIAGKLFVKAMRTGMLDNSSKKSPEPYFYLAEIIEKKAEDKQLELLKKQRYLLQAAALYNFVCNYLKSRDTDVELSKRLSKLVSRKLLDIQENMITLCGGNPLQSRFNAECKKNELKNVRNEVKESLESIECQSSASDQRRLNKLEARQAFKDQTAEVKRLSGTVSERMKQFFASIIDECLALLGTPSYDYEVIVFGSLARDETTPYSDFEWAILTSSEEEERKVFFRNLTNLVHLQVINLGETILPSMNIEEINGEWFYDDVTARGVSFDGLLPQACKIPLGNMQDFELIHTPEKMAEFQSNEWYQKNWSLADTLMTFSPLRSKKSILVEAYRNEIDKILSNPCDSESCQHDASSDVWPTRGSCRGIRVLHKDLSVYGDMIMGNNELDEGKFYDVKKEIYRLPDRVIAALAKCCEVKSTGIFAVLDELYEKEVISSEARDNLASASAIAIRLRLSTYLKAGKQGEHLSSNSNNKTRKKVLIYHMPTDQELFHFFFVAIPLYDELQQLKTSRNIPSSLESRSFFNDSDITMGHIYCRLLKYDKAIDCYERAVRENPNNLSAKIRRIRLAPFATHNRQESGKIRENLDDLLGKLVKNFAQLDTNVDETMLEFTPLMDRVHMDECRQLIEGLLFAAEIYVSSKYFAVAEKIINLFTILTSNKSMIKELMMLYVPCVNNATKKNEIDTVVSAWTSFIDEEGVSTRSIVWLNRLGGFLFNQGKLEKAYRCFQRALSMEHLLFGTRPNVNMMTSLHFLGMIAIKLHMKEEGKFYCKSLVQLCESFGGIKAKLLIKRTYVELLLQNCTADEALRYAANGLNVTTESKNEIELVLNCFLYYALAINLQSPERAWEAILNALACRKDCRDAKTRECMIFAVGRGLRAMKKSKEGIELLKEELPKLTLKSQVQEKVLCLKALGKLCLEQGLAPEAKEYYSQAIDIQLENDEHVFHDLECRIGVLKAVVMEDSESNEKPGLGKALLTSAMKLPASKKKCSFLRKIGKLCQSIGDIGDARLCCVEALRSAKEWHASDKKCSFLIDTGNLCESISEFPLALQFYDEALNSYKEESNISKKPPFVEFGLEMKLGFLAEKMFSIDSAQRLHYDQAAAILRQHAATGDVDSKTVVMFLQMSEVYRSIDRNEELQLLLEGLKVSEIVYEKDKSPEVVTASLQQLSRTYYFLGDMQNSMKYRKRQIEMELELYSSNPFLERIVHTLIKWALISFDVPSGNDSIERVSDFFLSSLNDKSFLLNTTAAKTIAAKCFTFLAVLFYTSGDFENAKSLNEKASQLFGEVQESVEAESDPCRETCDLMKMMLSSEKILPSHRTELYIYVFNIGGPHPDIIFAEEEWLLLKYVHDIDAEFIDEEKEQARSTLVEEQNTCSSPPVHSQLEALEYFKSKGEFRLVAEIHASLQPRLLSFYGNNLFDGPGKLISEAIEAKDENRPGDAIRFLDLALQLQLPEGQCRRTTKILRLRGECFLSMGHFRSAAIDFTKADALYSIETIDKREDLHDYSEVLTGLIKSEILCDDLDTAWLVCQKGIKLVSYHEFEENVYQQFFYLAAKCMNILSERGKDKEEKLDKVVSQCLQVDFPVCDHGTMAGGSIWDSYMEAQLFLGEIFKKRKLGGKLKESIELKLQVIKAYYMDIAMHIIPADSIRKSKPETEPNTLQLERKAEVDSLASEIEPEFWKKFARFARVLVMEDDLQESIFWLDRSLLVFFSVDLPDFLSFYEEFLPLLQAITATKSSAADQSRSPFQQAVDMCTRTLTNEDKTLKYVNQFLTNLIIIYRSLGQAREAMVVAEVGLEMTDFMCDNSDNDKLNNRCRMLLHLAQIHQQNSLSPVFNADEELNLAEHYYLCDQRREEDILLCKDLSYANFLCERKRFVEAITVLEDITNLGELVWIKYVYIEYFSCAFFGAGVEKSVKIDGELFTTVGNILCNLLVRAYVGMEKKKEAVAMCELLTNINILDVHEQLYGKRPSCKPYLVGDCHHKLLSLLGEEVQNQFQNCGFPLSSANLAKLYYMLGEYEMAVKYLPEDVESPEMLEMKISCLHLAGNEMVDASKRNESISFFRQFLEELHDKEGFLNKSLNNQYEILQTYHFANQYYLFRSLGRTHAERENIDAAIQCYERCIELDEDFTCGQDIVATLSKLYQTKALTVDLENEDSRTIYMDLAWELFQKLFQKIAELTTFVERSFGSLLTRLGRCEEAVEHFYKAIERPEDIHITFVGLGNLEKPFVDVHLRREIEALGRVLIPLKVLAAYDIIVTLMSLNQNRKAQKVAFFLESVVEEYPWTLPVNELITHSMAGYAYKITGNKEKAVEIFVSVLEMNPGHPPLTEALESLYMQI